MNSGIYTITNIVNNKIYIGYTKNFYARKHSHFSALNHNRHYNYFLQKSYNKYGKDNFIFEVLVECDTIEILPSIENYWCNILNTHNMKYGYNIAFTNPTGYNQYSKESRLKLSKALTGRKHTELSKQRMSESAKGRIFSEETLDKISKSMKGKNTGKRGKRDSKIIEQTKNTWILKYQNGYKNLLQKPVLQYDLEGNFIKEWESSGIAAKTLNINKKAIQQCCRKSLKTSAKFKWKYKDKNYE